MGIEPSPSFIFHGYSEIKAQLALLMEVALGAIEMRYLCVPFVGDTRLDVRKDPA